MQRAYRVELSPNNKQRTLMQKAAGTARFAWNWGLSNRTDRYRNNKANDRYTDAIKQHRELNILKKDKLAWMYEVSKCAPQEALRDLDKAFTNFFKKIHKFPKYKKKGKSRDSFRLTGSISIKKSRKSRKCKSKKTGKNHTCSRSCKENLTATGIKLPKLGIVRLKEIPALKDESSILSATVSRTADRWFVSLTVKESHELIESEKKNLVGGDLGLSRLMTLSDGTVYKNPKHLKTNLRKLKMLSKSLSRKKLRSNNWIKASRILARKHMQISNKRSDTLHKLTTKLSVNYSHIVVEDLNVAGMIKNRKLSRSIADVGWGEFRRMLEYKTKWRNKVCIIVPRFFPSSKLCSNCWWKNTKLELSDRIFKCDRCQFEMDRDLNAAKNMEIYGLMYIINPIVAESWNETKNACGGDVRPLDAFLQVVSNHEKSTANDGGNPCET